MAMRFCSRCDSEVEDTGGFCLLGHRLALDPPFAPIEELRAEVDRSFEEARAEVAAVVSGAAAAAPGPARRLAPPPPPPPAVSKRPDEVTVPDTAVTKETVSYLQAPAAPRTDSVWAELDQDVDVSNDPISAFAPAPRMDWGPNRSRSHRRRLRRSETEQDA
ncbi:MAG: hypothetical protein M3280_02465 [Actinomycetota bacterium]|nr:hypothetical protein [Actinomycetota bacterium]